MNAHEGLMRIAKCISVLGWVWLVLAIVVAVAYIFTSRVGTWGEGMAYAAIGVVGLIVAQGLAWVVRGFAAPKH